MINPNKTYAAFLNLDHRKDRLEHMEKQLSRFNIKAERVRGRLPHEFGNWPRLDKMRNRTPGAIGCYYGQRQIMENALTQGKNAFVMEDDIVFCQDFDVRMAYVESWIDGKEWDVIWLGGTFHSPAYWHPKGPSGFADVSAHLGYDVKPTDDPRIVQTFGAFSTHAYIVNVKSIQKILTLLDEFLPNSIGIDHNFIYWQGRGLKTFAFVPGCVKQFDAVSDIGTGITYFSGFSKLNGSIEDSKYWYQEYATDFDPKGWTWK